MSPGRGDELEPLPEAYARVTNPERFRPLHRHALDLIRTPLERPQLMRRFGPQRDRAAWRISSFAPAGWPSRSAIVFV